MRFKKRLGSQPRRVILSCMRLAFFVVATLATISSIQAGPVSLLEGKLKLDTTDAFVWEKEAKMSKQSIADFKGRKSDAWGTITRGTHGLQPEGLANYMEKKVAEYTKGLSWLPRLDWLKKEIVTINGRKWADMRYIAPRKNAKDARDGLMYTRILATSYGGQLIEIMFTSNTDENPTLKDNIDKVIESVGLEE
jgi:hypothetical protein